MPYLCSWQRRRDQTLISTVVLAEGWAVGVAAPPDERKRMKRMKTQFLENIFAITDAIYPRSQHLLRVKRSKWSLFIVQDYKKIDVWFEVLQPTNIPLKVKKNLLVVLLKAFVKKFCCLARRKINKKRIRVWLWWCPKSLVWNFNEKERFFLN